MLDRDEALHLVEAFQTINSYLLTIRKILIDRSLVSADDFHEILEEIRSQTHPLNDLLDLERLWGLDAGESDEGKQ